MSRPPSPAIAHALAAIASGVSWRTAAKDHGVTMSGISKALKREASRCPTCGQVTHAKMEKAK